MINELIKLATHLDQRGLVKEADYLDMVIKKATGNNIFIECIEGPTRSHNEVVIPPMETITVNVTSGGDGFLECWVPDTLNLEITPGEGMTIGGAMYLDQKDGKTIRPNTQDGAVGASWSGNFSLTNLEEDTTALPITVDVRARCVDN